MEKVKAVMIVAVLVVMMVVSLVSCSKKEETSPTGSIATATPVSTATPVGGGEGKIVFFSYIDGNDEIYVMDANGSNQTRLTNNNVADVYPVWSPDGTKIAFNSDRDGNWEIYVMDANGNNSARLTNNNAEDWVLRGGWK
jgi:Tol biopolymer transport system component